MSLRVPRFLIPINSEAPHFWVTFWLSPTLEFSSPGCSFAITALSTDCSFFLSSSSITNFPSKDLFSSKERFSLDFSKERRGHLVEWMEKTSFARLNKLFEIDVVDSVVRPPTQRNKKYVTRPVQRARTPSLASPSSSSSSSSSSSLSSSSSSNKPEARVGRLVSPIICEEEEMTSNLRVGFCERKRKCLSKSIVVNPSSLKKTYPKPTIDPLSKSILSTIVAVVTSNPNKKPSSIDDISYHEARKPFIVLENISEESFKCLPFSPHCLKTTYVPS
ncbi:hypothetical protein CK203_031197 [Vitis vinifera]|uniref:Uncharacterized protein n=1 Tax=Vitis vinifera TaxID=29760 RepID=A0A438J0I4_VITVI|nr:hypothetical protein CK203_031197 [Vitis vinifera]